MNNMDKALLNLTDESKSKFGNEDINLASKLIESKAMDKYNMAIKLQEIINNAVLDESRDDSSSGDTVYGLRQRKKEKPTVRKLVYKTDFNKYLDECVRSRRISEDALKIFDHMKHYITTVGHITPQTIEHQANDHFSPTQIAGWINLYTISNWHKDVSYYYLHTGLWLYTDLMEVARDIMMMNAKRSEKELYKKFSKVSFGMAKLHNEVIEALENLIDSRSSNNDKSDPLDPIINYYELIVESFAYSVEFLPKDIESFKKFIRK